MAYDIETKIQAIEMYKSGLLAREVADRLNLNPTTVAYWVRKAGVARHRGPQSKIEREDFFDVVDSEEKAYFLGWLMADGNVSIYNNQYSLKIHTSLEDKDLIDGFLLWIKSTNSTKIKDNQSYYTSLTSVHMIKSLMNLGVIPSKSGRESIPNIESELIRHFIRGYFDGDGITCVGQSKRSGFCGSQNILKDIQDVLNVEFPIIFNNGTFYFQSGRSFSRNLYSFIYEGSNIWLDRKRNRMDIICGNTEVTNRTNKLLAP